MSRRIRVQEIQEDVSPNLIPMIDIMFLLLLFFMLGADMGQRELEEVMLPKAVSIKEDKEDKGKVLDRLTINVFHRYPTEIACSTYAEGRTCRETGHWRIGVKGSDYTDPARLEGLLKEEAGIQASGEAPGGPSERKVMIRADAAAPYGLVKDVMNHCARVGIWKIECGAARPPDGPRAGG